MEDVRPTTNMRVEYVEYLSTLSHTNLQYHGHRFATPAILWQLILVLGYLSVYYRTFEVIIQSDPGGFGT